MPAYGQFPMVLNNVYIGMLAIRTDQQKYFDIPNPTEAELTAAQYKTSGTDITRQRYPNRLESAAASGPSITVKRKARTKNHSKDHLMRGGRAIKIPTELRSKPVRAATTDGSAPPPSRENIRFTTIKFPGNADLAEISAWLHAKLVAKKPTYFKAPGGRAYPLAPFVGTVTGDGAGTTA